jgi:hypothetical protein
VAVETKTARPPNPDPEPQTAFKRARCDLSAMPKFETAKFFTNSQPRLIGAMNGPLVARHPTFLSDLVSFLFSKQLAWQPGRQFGEFSTSR